MEWYGMEISDAIATGENGEMLSVEGAQQHQHQQFGNYSISDNVAGANRGRWTPQEHSIFLRGIEKYGTNNIHNCEKIAILVKSRSSTQVRTHFQKYLQNQGFDYDADVTMESSINRHGGNKRRRQQGGWGTITSGDNSRAGGSMGAAENSGSKRARKDPESNFHVDTPSFYSSNTSSYASESDNVAGVDHQTMTRGDSIEVKGKSHELHDANDNGQSSTKDAADEEKKEADNDKTNTTDGIAGDKKQPSEKDAQPYRDAIHTDGGNNPNEHDRFIYALEKYGSSSLAWQAMATDLKWPVDEVKLYAYSYFKKLIHGRKSKCCEDLVESNANQNNGGSKTLANKPSESESIWSFHELILLDTLMVKHCSKDLGFLTDNDRGNKEAKRELMSQQSTIWEKIASQLPGKTAKECKMRWMSRNSDGLFCRTTNKRAPPIGTKDNTML